MNLQPRSRVMTNAALSLIALHGHNPRKVTASANAHIAKGTPANQAYTMALEEFAARVPAMRRTLETALAVVAASDDATVATYDRALTAYNNTGDASHLDAIAPMALEDAKTLAVRNGEVSADDALYWDVHDALGIDEAAFAAVPEVPNAATPADGSPQASSFQFANGNPAPAQAAPAAPAAQAGFTATGYRPSLAKTSQQAPQGSYGAGQDVTQPQQSVTGYRPGMTGQKARQWHGTPMGDIQYIQTATGFRPAPTGEQARREAGVPLGE